MKTTHLRSKDLGDGSNPQPPSPREPTVDPSSRRRSLLSLLLFALVVTAYLPAFDNGFVWDDDAYVSENETLETLDGLVRIWTMPRSTPQYYPLVFTSFWVERQLFGLQPVSFHVVNVVIHALVAILLWRVARRLEIPGAWLAAAIFALHPVHLESVAWISERKNLLSGLFYMGALLAYSHGFLRREHPERDEPRTRHLYWWALALYVLSLLSKTVACTFPVTILLLTWWLSGRITKSDLMRQIPFFAIGALFGLHTVWLEVHHVGARGTTWDLTLVERFLVAGRALWFYAGKLCLPRQLSFNYPRWTIDSTVWWQYLFVSAFLVVLVALFTLRRRIGRGPLVGVLFFAITLLPALGFFNVFPMRYSFVADHFQYLASIGPITLTAAALARLLRRGTMRWLFPLVTAGLVLVLGLRVWVGTYRFENGEALWRDTLAKHPRSWMAHNNLGSILADQGRFEQALDHYRTSLRIEPSYAYVHNNVGTALLALGETRRAISAFTDALELKPQYPEACNNLGVALLQERRVEEAIEYFVEALWLRPGYPSARRNLQRILTNEERIKHLLEMARSREKAHSLSEALFIYELLDTLQPRWRNRLGPEISRIQRQREHRVAEE